MKESGNRHREAGVPRGDLDKRLLMRPLPPGGAGRSPFARTSHGQLPAYSE